MSVGISMRSRGGSAPPSKGGASSWGAGGPTGAGDGVAPLRSPDVVLKLDAVAEVLKRRQRADVNVPVVGHRGRRLTRSGGRTVAHVGSAAGGRDLARPGVARARTYHAIRYTTMVNQSGAFEPPGRAAHPRVACESFWPSLASPPCPPPPAAVESRPPAAPSRFFDLDPEFPSRYVEDVVGPRLLTLHRAIKPQSDRYSRLYVSVLLDQLATSVKEHETIAAAIAQGDLDAAQRAAETNWHNAAERLTSIIAKQGERGSWPGWTPASAVTRKR